MSNPEFTKEELATEEWRDVVGYEGIYSVSNLGRVRPDASREKRHIGICIRGSISRGGYRVMGFCKRGTRCTKTVHSAVARAFIGPRPKDVQVNHKDGVKLNNRSTNLEYVTQKANSEHAVKMGLTPTGDRQGLRKHPECVARGTRAHLAKLTDDDVRAIRSQYATGATSLPKLGTRYGVSAQTIWCIVHKKTWTHI